MHIAHAARTDHDLGALDRAGDPVGRLDLGAFDVDDAEASNPNVLNPQVGRYLLGHDNDAYVCTTGRAFPRPGTVNPLHVRLVEGPLPLVRCLEDVRGLPESGVIAWIGPKEFYRKAFVQVNLNTGTREEFLLYRATDPHWA